MGRLRCGARVALVRMIRNRNVPQLPFLAANVYTETARVVWDFKDEQFDGYGLLALACNEPVIAFVSRGKNGRVRKTLALREILSRVYTHDTGILIERAKQAAEFLGKGYDLTEYKLCARE